MENPIYEFTVDQSTWKPQSIIQYVGANKKFKPCWMNFEYDEFEWGDWKDTWIVNAFKPCMLRVDGRVAYYLDKDDLTRNADNGHLMLGELRSTAHNMNAMVQVSQIWIKEEKVNEDKFHISLADHQVDASYDCWTHYNRRNQLVDFYYYPMYQGSLEGSQIRSLSGRFPVIDLPGNELKQYCKNNGNGWDCDEWSFRRLMQYVLLLLGGTTYLRDAFGYGYVKGKKGGIRSGGHEHRGMFWGDNSKKQHVVVLGIEDFWGNVGNLTNGLICSGTNNYHIKMTPGIADGSHGVDYSDNLDDYSTFPRPLQYSSSGVPRKMELIPGRGMFPVEYSVNYDENYCDRCSLMNWDDKMWARCGGDSSSDDTVGPLTIDVIRSLEQKFGGASPTFKKPD